MAKSKIDSWLTEDKLILLEGWAREGLTDEQIAKNMGIATSTLYEWKKKEKEFSEALKKGKEVVDFEVENALLKKALGYTITIEEEKLDKYGDVHTLKKDVHVPGDTTAQIFWLKNRKPDKWRDKVIDNESMEAINNATDMLIKIRKTANEQKNN